MAENTHPEPPFVAYAGTAPYLFVSFSHQDAEAVYDELRWLRADGVNVWYDEAIGPGHVWPRELARAIDAASVVLIFISRNSVASSNCLREVHFAIEHGKPLLAVHLDDCQLPRDWEFAIGDRQAILKSRTSRTIYRDKLRGALAQHLPIGDPHETGARPPPQAPAEPIESAHVRAATRDASRRRRVPVAAWAASAAILVAISAAIFIWWSQLRDEHARALVATATLESEQALAAGEWLHAYRIAEALPESVPSALRAQVWSKVSTLSKIDTDPQGAKVYWRPYDTPSAPWSLVGTTPVEARLPFTLVAMRLDHDGYVSRYISHHWMPTVWKLQALDGVLPDAVQVTGGETALTSGPLYHAPPVVIGDYLIDRYEVTNRQFQAFVDAGGYTRRELWEHPFEKDGAPLDWDQAMALFKDRTGKPGPSTWEVGNFPTGKADYPVTGVSWYEAAAYARFVGRDLPTLYHWYRAADLGDAVAIVPLSNLEGKDLAPVGSFQGFTSVGAFDMAGNAREWVANAEGDLRYTLGGGWNDPNYAFLGPQPQLPFDRSATNGFRLITNLGDRQSWEKAAGPVDHRGGDYSKRKPVSDDTFASFRELYEYEHTPLNAVVEKVETLSYGVSERITFDVGYANPYGNKRMVLYLLRPKDQSKALQTVVYFPGAGAAVSKDIEKEGWIGPDSHAAFLVKSGRAVAFPLYEGTFERGDGVIHHLQGAEYLNYLSHVRQDLGRSLDYLETRPDLRSREFGYFGFSWGGSWGPIVLAEEARLKAAVLYVAGLPTETPLPAAGDPLNFAPRVHVPVLIINARYDQVFPLKTHAQPLFELIGTAQKEHYVSEGGYLAGEGGHFVPTPEVARETLRWFDKYLGPVR